MKSDEAVVGICKRTWWGSYSIFTRLIQNYRDLDGKEDTNKGLVKLFAKLLD